MMYAAIKRKFCHNKHCYLSHALSAVKHRGL